MQVRAYRCDNCGKIKIDDEITGIMPSQDMFDLMNSYPETKKLDRTNIHFCLSCYDIAVIKPIDTECTRQKNRIRNIENWLSSYPDDDNTARKSELKTLEQSLLSRGTFAFTHKVKELSFGLRQACVKNFNNKKIG